MTQQTPPLPQPTKSAARSRRSPWSQSVVAKAIFAGFIALLLLIPLAWVRSLIAERQQRYHSVVSEIAQIWGQQQTVSGPVIVIPYRIKEVEENGRQRWEHGAARMLPEELHIEGVVRPEQRYRGIFDVIVYESELRVSGSFAAPVIDVAHNVEAEIFWDRARLSVGIPDVRGISRAVELSWGSRTLPFAPGSELPALFTSGFHAPAPGLATLAADESISFAFDLHLRGSRELRFLPLGKQTDVRLESGWPSPSFSGAFLPGEREVTASGFSASWEIPYFARSYPQTWTTREDESTIGENLYASAFGVDLIMPVDLYLKSTRSVKYGFLFVGLTFLSFFLVEILHPVRVHPFQYLLVGMAICLFYLLLLSLAEHLGFGVAYAVSSLATVALVGGYCRSAFGAWARAAAMAALLGALYGFLWVLLRGEDYALLTGALGLFAILAAVMYLTRRLDWYRHELPAVG